MQLLQNEPLAFYTSLRAGGPAENLIILNKGDNFKQIITDSRKNGPVKVLGYGTNSLVSDKGIRGTVILDVAGSSEQISETRYKVDSGVDWDIFVQIAINKNLWGLEFTSGIPGGVGAAVVGNIAAYGQKIADIFVEATMLKPDGTTEVWKKDKFEFTYRESSLKKPENQELIILDGTFELSPAPTGELEYQSALKVAEEMGVIPDTLKNRRKIIMETRYRAGSLLPSREYGPWTAGSFFKNPVVSESQIDTIISYDESGISRDKLIRQSKIHTGTGTRVSAAHVLLAAGFKRGQKWGNVRLHPDHILKIENLGNASATEIYQVVQMILKTVKDRLDIELEPEVRFIGEF